MGWDNPAMWSDNIRFVVKNLFVVQQTNINESFDEAITRLELDEITKQAQTEFHYTAIFYGMLSPQPLAIVPGYCGTNTTRACILASVLGLVMGAFWFREHFWYIQMKQRRLGLTLSEWFYLGILKRGQ